MRYCTANLFYVNSLDIDPPGLVVIIYTYGVRTSVRLENKINYARLEQNKIA